MEAILHTCMQGIHRTSTNIYEKAPALLKRLLCYSPRAKTGRLKGFMEEWDNGKTDSPCQAPNL